MIESYTIGIKLALDNGVSAGVAAIRRDLSTLDRAMQASMARLDQLRAAAAEARSTGAAVQPATTRPPAQAQAGILTSSDPSPRPDAVGTATSPIAAPRAAVVPPPPMVVPAASSLPAKALATHAAPVAPPAAPPSAPVVPVRLPVAPTLATPAISAAWASSPPPLPEPMAPRTVPTATPAPAAAAAPVTTLAAVAPRALPAVIKDRTLTAAPAAPVALPDLPAIGRTILPSVPEQGVRSAAVVPVPAPFDASPPPGPAPELVSPSPGRRVLARPAPEPLAPALPNAGARTAPHIPRFKAPLPAPPSTAFAPSAPNAADTGSSSSSGGDVFLDGVRIGRWMSDQLSRAASRPPSGATGFDLRQSPAWAGATVSY